MRECIWTDIHVPPGWTGTWPRHRGHSCRHRARGMLPATVLCGRCVMHELNKIDRSVATTGAAAGAYPSAWLSLRGPAAQPSTRGVVLASVLGGGLGALAAATMFPALPAL